jgi:hypothetical protein
VSSLSYVWLLFGRSRRQPKQRPILVPLQEAIHIGREQPLRQIPPRDPVEYHRPDQNRAVRLVFAFLEKRP